MQCKRIPRCVCSIRLNIALLCKYWYVRREFMESVLLRKGVLLHVVTGTYHTYKRLSERLPNALLYMSFSIRLQPYC